MADTDKLNEGLATIIRMMIGSQLFNNNNSSHAVSANQFGKNVGNALPAYITGNPQLQAMMRPFLGPIAGNVMESMFPGMSGGLNVRDSVYRRMRETAHDTEMRAARKNIGAGINDSLQGGLLTNVAVQLAGARNIQKGMGPEQFGSMSTIAGYGTAEEDEDGNITFVDDPGSQSAFLTNRQVSKNREIHKRLFGKKGLYRAVSSAYTKDIDSFGGMQGEELGLLIGDAASRGQLGDGDNAKTIEGIKKTAKSIQSIRDIIKGPLREVVAQMEQTFGSGYTNTFGPGGAADLVNKIRAAGSMSGFSTKQIMALAPTAQAMVAQVGGDKSNAADTLGLTGLIMGLTRGQDKSFSDDTLTGKVQKMVVGAQQSRLSKNISSARSLIDGEEKKKQFDAAVKAAQENGEDITLAKLSEWSGAKISTIAGNRESMRTKREMHNSSIGMTTALMDQFKDETRYSRRNVRDALGSEEAYQAFLRENGVKAGDKEAEEQLLYGDTNKWKGIDKDQLVEVENAFRERSKRSGFNSFNERNLAYRNIREGVDREVFSKEMGKLYKDTSYGGSFGTNLLKAAGSDDKSMNNILNTVLNTKGKSEAYKNLLKRGGKLGDRKGLKALIEQLGKDADALGLEGEEKQKYLNDNMMKSVVSKSSFGDYVNNKSYKEDFEKNKKDVGYKMSGSKFNKEVEAAIKAEETSTGESVDLVRKKEIARKIQIKKKIADLRKKAGGMKEGSKERKSYEELANSLANLKDEDIMESDDIIDKKAKETGIVFKTDREKAAEQSTEVNIMDQVAKAALDFFKDIIPLITDVLKAVLSITKNPGDAAIGWVKNTINKWFTK